MGGCCSCSSCSRCSALSRRVGRVGGLPFVDVDVLQRCPLRTPTYQWPVCAMCDWNNLPLKQATLVTTGPPPLLAVFSVLVDHLQSVQLTIILCRLALKLERFRALEGFMAHFCTHLAWVCKRCLAISLWIHQRFSSRVELHANGDHFIASCCLAGGLVMSVK